MYCKTDQLQSVHCKWSSLRFKDNIKLIDILQSRLLAINSDWLQVFWLAIQITCSDLVIFNPDHLQAVHCKWSGLQFMDNLKLIDILQSRSLAINSDWLQVFWLRIQITCSNLVIFNPDYLQAVHCKRSGLQFMDNLKLIDILQSRSLAINSD